MSEKNKHSDFNFSCPDIKIILKSLESIRIVPMEGLSSLVLDRITKETGVEEYLEILLLNILFKDKQKISKEDVKKLLPSEKELVIKEYLSSDIFLEDQKKSPQQDNESTTEYCHRLTLRKKENSKIRLKEIIELLKKATKPFEFNTLEALQQMKPNFSVNTMEKLAETMRPLGSSLSEVLERVKPDSFSLRGESVNGKGIPSSTERLSTDTSEVAIKEISSKVESMHTGLFLIGNDIKEGVNLSKDTSKTTLAYSERNEKYTKGTLVLGVVVIFITSISLYMSYHSMNESNLLTKKLIKVNQRILEQLEVGNRR